MNHHPPRVSRAARIFCLSLLPIAAAAPGRAQQKPAPPPQDALARMNDAMDALTKKVWPSVVQIQVTSYGARDQSTRDDTSVVVGRQRSVGSGFVIDPDGKVSFRALPFREVDATAYEELSAEIGKVWSEPETSGN